ncbi:MAG: aldehyde dehydrogenase [Phycisphaerales bacterium]|nr:aldehyde dehydrogenase family protein [Phycisphaerae bacterium]NNF43753.1 aldehyde dehydrogenase [Phycisphaerales bacterium]NNM26410.1 aldehyde dehydrogenase [Phycisphaerales bacterium]
MSTLTSSPAATTLASHNPADGSLVGEVPVTPTASIADVVARSRAAGPAWRALSFEERLALIAPAGPTLVARAAELGDLLTREMGKPLAEGTGEVEYCGSSLEKKLAEIAAALAPESFEDDATTSTVHYDPFGVCAAITPWNFPLAMPHSLVIPALVAGNTVILKPSEETPLIAQAYADILNETLPADVLQVVHGADDQGKALVAADIDLIAFTGSREVGCKILTNAGGDLKRVILELGGKDPMIVLDDADLEAAARFAVRNSFRNAGQVCVSTERIYVDERVASQFEDAVLRLTAEQKQGDGREEGVTVGPMISERQRDHVLQQLATARTQGATVAAGGDHHGNFITPTVVTNVDHDMDIMREETFGPVACIMRFAGDEEAVRLANDTPFGLGACVFGGDRDRAGRVARQLTAGMVGINKGCGGASGTPWVGAQQSGYGYHSGTAGHRQFAQPRVLSAEK